MFWLNERERNALERFVDCGCAAMLRAFLHNRNLRPGLFFVCSNELDLFHLATLDSKKGSHLNDLADAHEIRWIGAEFLYARNEFAATHPFGYIETESALAVFLKL